MHVKMLRTAAGPEFAASVDQIVEVDDKFGRQLIDDGSALEARVHHVEYASTFHGGLTAVAEGRRSVTTPPNPDYSQARESAEVEIPVGTLDRRTADEVAADARLAAHGPVTATGPVDVLTSDEQAAVEVEAKVNEAVHAPTDPKADDTQKVKVKAKGDHNHKTAKADEPK